MDLQKLVRKNIYNLKAYSSARNEFKGNASVFLDANENPLSQNYNRYPDPLQIQLKNKISIIKNTDISNIFLGNGSDEPIDLVIRIFCEPHIDNIVAIDPTYGMYQVCADINAVEYRKVSLNKDFSIDSNKMLESCDKNTKLIFLCSPNNPTGNILNKTEIEKIIKKFDGIVVVDEAYIDFSFQNSWLPFLLEYPNLIILQTFSKAWGMAAVRLGIAFASESIIYYFNKVKYPYNINILTQKFVENEIGNLEQKDIWVDTIIKERKKLYLELSNYSFVKKIYPSDANFLLVKMDDPVFLYDKLVEKGIIVRNRHTVSLCSGCLRITIGSSEENKILNQALSSIQAEYYTKH